MRMNPIGGNNEAKATVISNGLKGKLLCMMNFLSTNPDIIQAHSGRMNCSLMGGVSLKFDRNATLPNVSKFSIQRERQKFWLFRHFWEMRVFRVPSS